MQKEVIVTGVKHYKGISAFNVGMNLEVEFDGINPFSNCAFSVSEKGVRLGSVAENPAFIPRKICSNITILARELKQLTDDGFTIVGAVVKEIVRNYAIVTLELGEPAEGINDEVVVLPEAARNSIYTVVGTKYHSANANVGDIVRFKVVKGTTTLFTEDGSALGVLPQGDRKVHELQAIGAPIVLNKFARSDFHTMENKFVVSHVVKDKYIFVREMTEADFNNNDETKGGDRMNFISLKDLCRSSLNIELLVDHAGNFSVFFECEGDCFKYPIIEHKGIKGVNI
ncbi:hypothetical protein [Methanobrevibacter sp.]|uniref:hypothetical protein n=1 Tax=Methanobrevibacter sp. TaxID=66852 RepID=UPI00386AAA4B